MSTTAVPDNYPKDGFMMTQVAPPAAAGQNVVVPGPGVATGSIPNVGAYNVSVPTAGFPTAGYPTAGFTNVGNAGVPFVTPVSNIKTGPVPNPLQKFLKSKPTALGTVQIMIGVITIALGILLTFGMHPFSVYSGITYWGSIIYIITGSLTVAAENKLNSCLVKGSLGMNVCSAIVAGTAVILLSLDFTEQLGYDPCYLYPYDNYKCLLYIQLMDKTYGISGMLLTLALLQLIISICISVFGCKATCCNEPVVSVVTVAPNHPAYSLMMNPYQTHSGQQDVLCITNRAVNVNNTPTENLPAHTSSARPENSVMVNGF